MMKRFVQPFLSDQTGAAAIEFAVIAPALIIITVGMFELAGLSSANAKFTNATQLMGNLVAQQTGMSNSQTSNFCTGAKYALSPMNTSSFTATVASVTNIGGTVSVDWQDTTCGGSTISNAAGIAAPLVPNNKDSVIIVSANYTYNALVTIPLAILLPSYSLSQTSFTRPRNVASIPHS